MKGLKNKTATILIVTMFLTSMAFTFNEIPSAASAGTKQTYPVIGATPNPVGVGQETLILIGITDATSSDLYGWTGLTVKVTKPDGTIETLNTGGPGYRTDSTGLTGVV